MIFCWLSVNFSYLYLQIKLEGADLNFSWFLLQYFAILTLLLYLTRFLSLKVTDVMEQEKL